MIGLCFAPKDFPTAQRPTGSHIERWCVQQHFVWYVMATANSHLSARHLVLDEGVHEHAQVLHAVEAINSVGPCDVRVGYGAMRGASYGALCVVGSVMV